MPNKKHNIVFEAFDTIRDIAFVFQTDKIAFKKSANDLDDIFRTSTEGDKIIMGILFKFETSGLINAYTMFFMPNRPEPEFSIEPFPLMNLSFDNNAYYINEHREGIGWGGDNHFPITNFDLKSDLAIIEEDKVPVSIDFFNEKTKLVYFSVDQLFSIWKFYDNLIISGCILKMGKKLTSNKEEGMLFNDTNFSLKIEGSDLKPEFGIVFRQKKVDITGSDDNLIVGGPGAIIGYPCPPEWRMYTNVIAKVMQMYPEIIAIPDLIKSLAGLFSEISINDDSDIN